MSRDVSDKVHGPCPRHDISTAHAQLTRNLILGLLPKHREKPGDVTEVHGVNRDPDGQRLTIFPDEITNSFIAEPFDLALMCVAPECG